LGLLNLDMLTLDIRLGLLKRLFSSLVESLDRPGLFVQLAHFRVIIQYRLDGVQTSLETVYLEIDLLKTVEAQCLVHGIIIY
jgi:hypothetical protein